MHGPAYSRLGTACWLHLLHCMLVAPVEQWSAICMNRFMYACIHMYNTVLQQHHWIGFGKLTASGLHCTCGRPDLCLHGSCWIASVSTCLFIAQSFHQQTGGWIAQLPLVTVYKTGIAVEDNTNACKKQLLDLSRSFLVQPLPINTHLLHQPVNSEGDYCRALRCTASGMD
jgi:hypothetical protein